MSSKIAGGSGKENTLAEKIVQFRDLMNQKALSLGRSPDDIRLLLVSKGVVTGRIREAFSAGCREFGENRVQELLDKKKQLQAEPFSREIKWHMIGHLQTNKVNQILKEVVLIHSLDRMALAEEIDRQAQKKGILQADCLIQVNTSGEETKFGLPPEEVSAFVQGIQNFRIRIRGLMTIGPNSRDEAFVRPPFRRLKDLQEQLKKKFTSINWNILSMGMSSDYRIAIEEGSNLIRIGTAVFGARS